MPDFKNLAYHRSTLNPYSSMEQKYALVLIACWLCGGSLFLLAQTQNNRNLTHQNSNQTEQNFWSDIKEKDIQRQGKRHIFPLKYRMLQLEMAQLKQLLATAPMENNAQQRSIKIQLPMPNGTMERFEIVESPVMEAGLAVKFPEIKTYLGQGIDDPRATVRLDWTYKGFHAMVLSNNGSVFIDPYEDQTQRYYISYYKRDFTTTKSFECQFDWQPHAPHYPHNIQQPLFNPSLHKSTGEQLRTYRLALACTGEYANFHGGTVNGVLSAMVTSVNRVTGVYENEVAVRLVLIANNDALIFLNAGSDPYNNNNSMAMLGQNQNTIDNAIGAANYDIGHVYGTGGGGIAGLGVVCENGSKARGVTGSSTPINDPFDIDYVAHEIGHQFGGGHTFNGNAGSCVGSNRVAQSAYEPGSGTTIMAYAGICSSQNIQSNSDAFFHTRSFDEITEFTINSNGNTCAQISNTGNDKPNVDAGTGGYVIPANTPFELVGSATDPNGDPLTYSWEQFDLGPAGPPNAPVGTAPLFRSFPPVNIPARTFPRIEDIVNDTQTRGEILPTYSRELNFRLTARDNQAGGGGVSYDGIAFEVTDAAGPFLVEKPNTNTELWQEGGIAIIEWEVANTEIAPVNCNEVDIYLSIDGGFTYPFTLATGVPNNGITNIIVPVGTATSQARVRVQCATSIFFDISDENFTINAVTVPDYGVFPINTSTSVCAPVDANFEFILISFLNYNEPVNLTATNVPDGTMVSFSSNPVFPGDTVQAIVTNTGNLATGEYPITVEMASASSNQSIDLEVIVYSETPTVANLLSPEDGATNIFFKPTLIWQPAVPQNASIEIATDINFTNIVEAVAGINTNTYVATNLSSYTVYYWRVKSDNDCVDGVWSEPFVFRTALNDCNTYANNTIVNILSFIPSVRTSSLNIADDVTILDVNVQNIRGTHAKTSDLSFTLESPAGTTVELFSQICMNEANFNISLDDQALTANYPCPPTDGNAYQPIDTLAKFNGESSVGTWQLTVEDHLAENGGQLQGWGLEVCFELENTNAEPQLINNDSLVLEIGRIGTITSNLLLSTDADNTPAELAYTLLTIPANGTLQLNDSILTVGATFTQTDIDNGNLKYRHTADVATFDSFKFNVNDGQGGWFGNPTYHIGAWRVPSPPFNNGEIIIFPNPAQNQVNFKLFLDNSETVRFWVYDAIGQQVRNGTITDLEQGVNQFEINTSTFTRGVYIVKLEGTSFELTERIMVVR